MRAIDEVIGEVRTILEKGWSLESSSLWCPENPARGQCSVTSLVINDFFGGEILKTETSGGWHFYNRIGQKRIDLTQSQFSEPIVYMDILTGRKEAFLDTNEDQYTYLKRKLGDGLSLID